MKISTKGRYGLKAMVDLAANLSDNSCITLKSIAERQGISEHYLEQLIAVLKKNGFVKSIRGAQGGYILNKSSSEISVGDLLRVLEGPLDLVDCVSNDTITGCGSGSCKKCVTKNVWEKLSNSFSEIVDSITLNDLVQDYKNNNDKF